MLLCLCFRGPWGITKEILQVEGIRGMFKGLTSTMAREMPGYFFFFGGYEITRHLLTPEGKTKDEIGKANES
jgi:solute carrier family 25 ornithine transporter 2/15